MEKIIVVNLKCGGCASTIKTGLAKIGMKNVKVGVDDKTVTFDGDRKTALAALSKMGYPQEGSKEADSLFKKAKSFVSCAIGKTNQ